jgi:dTMP kinase
LIVLEGIDGSGKSTLHRALLRRWRAAGFAPVRTREPADLDLGRRALAEAVTHPSRAALYFTLDRILARPRIESLLSKGRLVVQDRSFFSTVAYQGSTMNRREARRLLDLERRLVTEPDRVILLDLPAKHALGRIGARGQARAPLERQRTLERVRRAYRSLATDEGWLVVDARRPPEDVAVAVDRTLRPFLARRLRRARPGR